MVPVYGRRDDSGAEAGAGDDQRPSPPAERMAFAPMTTVGIAVLLGWLDKLAPRIALPKITLLILSTVALFLLLEADSAFRITCTTPRRTRSRQCPGCRRLRSPGHAVEPVLVAERAADCFRKVEERAFRLKVSFYDQFRPALEHVGS
ncbi:hypothetical protein [Streptomyces sp. NPDC055287]